VCERIPSPAGLPGDVVIHRVSLTVDAAVRAELMAALSAHERARAERFHRAGDRERFAVVRGALRTILADCGAGAADRLVIAPGAHGKPELSPPSPLRFNVSHSGGVGLVAVAFGCEVGVDVERIRYRLGLRTVARRFFAPAEVSALERLAPADFLTGFYRCWTRKEAYVKARGLGLRMALDGFEVDVGTTDMGRTVVVGDPESPMYLTDLAAPDGYVAALALAAERVPP
jgi:4'-phosphopantetheinyl transferase